MNCSSPHTGFLIREVIFPPMDGREKSIGGHLDYKITQNEYNPHETRRQRVHGGTESAPQTLGALPPNAGCMEQAKGDTDPLSTRPFLIFLYPFF